MEHFTFDARGELKIENASAGADVAALMKLVPKDYEPR
jgi:hypothetical protein